MSARGKSGVDLDAKCWAVECRETRKSAWSLWGAAPAATTRPRDAIGLGKQIARNTRNSLTRVIDPNGKVVATFGQSGQRVALVRSGAA